MATTTGRARGAAPRSSSRGKGKRSGPGIMDRLKLRVESAADALPQVAGSPRLRREVLGFALIVVAILTALVLGRGGDDGRLVDWWGEALTSTFGRAAQIAPLLIGLVAVRALGSQPGRVLEPRHIVGGFLFTMSVVGLLQLGARPVGTMAGGYTGAAIAILLQRVLGQVGSGLVLFVAGVFGVFLMAGTDLQTSWSDLRALGRLIARASASAWAAIVRAFRFVTPDIQRPRGIPVDDLDDDAEADLDHAFRGAGQRRGIAAEPVDGALTPVPRTRVRAESGGSAAPATSRAAASAALVADAPPIRRSDPFADPVDRSFEDDDPGATEAEWRPAPRRRPAAQQAPQAVAQPVPAHALPAPAPAVAATAPAPARAARASSAVAEAASRAEPVIVLPAPAPRRDAPPAAPAAVRDRVVADDDDSLRRLLEVALADQPAAAEPAPERRRQPSRPSTPAQPGRESTPRAGASDPGQAATPAARTAARPVPAPAPDADDDGSDSDLDADDIPVVRMETPARPSAPLRPAPSAARLPMPEIGKLAYYDAVEPDTAALHAKARTIEETLASFRVEARVREINPGPAVTQYALEPGTGTKVRRITELQNDLALALAAPSVRIEAPIPGMARVGLEIPNDQIATVGLRETLESPVFLKGKQKLPIPLGRDVNGRYVVGDLTRMPHLLIAGATGAGKSVCLNCIISTFLLTKSPDELKLVMIDPKMVELTGYNGVPHLQCPVVTEMDKVVGTLRLVLREMERRYAMFANLGVRNLDGYRDRVADEPGAERLPYLVVIIDELADLMMTAPDDVEGLLVRLAQMARATGIHLIIATQRPSVDVVTGLIKANVPSRVAFAVSSLTDSRVVLDMPGAERLLGRGDMLYLPADAAKPQRVQGAFLEDRDAQYIVNHWHTHAPVPQYAPEWLDVQSSSTGSAGTPDPGEWEDDPLFEQAMGIVRAQGTASASMLQRRLRIGYNRAARLIERMEEEGMIGPADGVRGRPVLFGGA